MLALWYDDARATFTSLVFRPTTSDVFLYTNKENNLFVFLHVDDFQVMGPKLDKIKQLMFALNKKKSLNW